MLFRKRKGGIKLSDEETESTVQQELNSSTEHDDLTAGSSDSKQKQKADALWADFLKDVGHVPTKPQSNSVCINEFC